MDSQVVLVVINLTAEKLEAIETEVETQARGLSRVEIMRQSVSKSIIVKATSLEDAIMFSNDYAPEHLILHLENPSEKVSLIENAGSVFVGPYTPERCHCHHLYIGNILANGYISAAGTMLQEQTTLSRLMDMQDSSAGSIRSLSKSISHRRKLLQVVSKNSALWLQLWPIAKVSMPTQMQ